MRTLKDLIRELQKLPQDLPVEVENVICDEGEAVAASVGYISSTEVKEEVISIKVQSTVTSFIEEGVHKPIG